MINKNKIHIMSQMQFEYYFNNNYDALSSFAFKLAKNKMDADDLIQETAVKAYKNFNRFVEGSSFKNWSFTILKNTFLSKYRKRKKMNVVNLPIDEMEIAINAELPIEDHSAETIKAVTQSIELLSEKSKEPFVMFLEGYRYKEIAESLDIPIGTVKSRIRFARTKLRKILTDKKINK